MPRGKPQSFPEFMERMGNYSRPLRIHREDSLHIDPLFCEECCNKMAQGGDRARYLGKAILPGNAVYPSQMQLLSTNQEFTVHYNQDNSIHHITVNANGGQIRPLGRGWQGYSADDLKEMVDR